MFEALISFVKTYPVDIITVLVIIAVAVIAIKVGYKKSVAKIALEFVKRAEKEYAGEKTGEIKFLMVASWLHDRMPKILKLFITTKDIAVIIENAVERMKKELEDVE